MKKRIFLKPFEYYNIYNRDKKFFDLFRDPATYLMIAIIDFWGDIVVLFLLLFSKIYGIENTRKIGEKLLNYADKKEKKKC